MPIDEPTKKQFDLRFWLAENKSLFALACGIIVLTSALYYLYLTTGLRSVATVPTVGVVETPDTFQIIVFDFSEAINADTAIIETDPPRIVRPFSVPNYPNRLSIIPALVGWDPGVEYTIKITHLVAQDGTKLRRPVTYKYLNTFDFNKVYEGAPY